MGAGGYTREQTPLRCHESEDVAATVCSITEPCSSLESMSRPAQLNDNALFDRMGGE